MRKFILTLFLIVVVLSDLHADAIDSLQKVIDEKNGIERVEARLELAFRARVSDFNIAKKQGLVALEEIGNLGGREDLQAQAYYYLGAAYYNHSVNDTAVYYLGLAEALAKKQNNNRLLGYVYQLMGAIHNSYYGNQKKAIEYYNQSIQHSLLAGNHNALGAVYSDLANLLRSNGAYEKALEYVFRARDSYRKGGYIEGEAWVYYLIGSIYGSTNMYEEAADSYREALKIYRELAKKDGIMGGVAICLDQLASVYLKLNQISLAREYNREALDLHRRSDSRYGLSTSLKYLADIEYKDGNFDKAIAILDSALNIKKTINNITGLASAYELYGMIFTETGEYRRALDSLYIGLEYAVMNKQLRHMADINRHLSENYRKLGEFEKAYHYKSRQVSISDSIYNMAATRKLLQCESLMEIEEKEAKIRELETENKLRELSLERGESIRRYLIGIVILSLVILGMFIYMYFMARKSHRELLESKKNVELLNATKDKFFSIIAHDLRGPFNSILGLAGLMQTKGRQYSQEESDKMAGAIYESAKNSYTLVNNLLEWSRSQTGSISFHPESISLHESTASVVDLLLPQARDKKVALEYDSCDFSIRADKNMLHAILRNLISNALKYSYPGDKVRIYAEDEGDRVRIHVIDTGIGINADILGKLFSINDSYKIAGTAGEKGTGLGLVICREFVEKHGGTIGVESEPGKGARFYFTIAKA